VQWRSQRGSSGGSSPPFGNLNYSVAPLKWDTKRGTSCLKIMQFLSSYVQFMVIQNMIAILWVEECSQLVGNRV